MLWFKNGNKDYFYDHDALIDKLIREQTFHQKLPQHWISSFMTTFFGMVKQQNRIHSLNSDYKNNYNEGQHTYLV